MDPLSKLQRLHQIEDEFSVLIKNDRKNWIRVAKLLQLIEEEKLFELRTTSFTRYVVGLAKENGINVSTLWRARSAAVTYMEIAGLSDVGQLEGRGIRTTPEQLEMYGKVRTIAPERIVRELQEKMLQGEGIRNELRALWKTYRPLKRGQTERGRKRRLEDYQVPLSEASQFLAPFSSQEDEMNALIASNQYSEHKIDGRKIEKYRLSAEEILRTNLVNALRSPAWAAYTLEQTFLNDCQYFAHIMPGYLSGMPLPFPANRTDAGMLVRVPSEERTPPILFGATVRVGLPSLKNAELLLQNAAYYHYYYVAIPLHDRFIEEAIKHTPKRIGIVGIQEQVEEGKHALKVIRRGRYQDIDPEAVAVIMTDLAMALLGWG